MAFAIGWESRFSCRCAALDFGTQCDCWPISHRSPGSLANVDEKYFKHQQPMWNMNIDHTAYDEEWQSRAIWKT